MKEKILISIALNTFHCFDSLFHPTKPCKLDFGIHQLPHTDKIVSYPICKFCCCGTFKKEDEYHCFVCGRIYFEKDGVWYYSNSRMSMKCKIEHLV